MDNNKTSISLNAIWVTGIIIVAISCSMIWSNVAIRNNDNKVKIEQIKQEKK